MLNQSELGKTVRTLRKARGLTQRKLAYRAGIAPAHLCCLELGRRGVSIDTLNRLAEVLALPAQFLFFLGSTAPKSKLKHFDELVESVKAVMISAVEENFDLTGQMSQSKLVRSTASKRLARSEVPIA